MQALLKNKIFKYINIILIAILFLYITTLEIILISIDSDKFSNDFLNQSMNNWIWIAISTYVVFIPGINYFKYYKLILKKKIHMDLLLSIAIHISYIFSFVATIVDSEMKIIVEPIGLLFVFDTLGKNIENKIIRTNTRDKASLESLKKDEVMTMDGKMVSISEVKVGDIIMFHQNEVIQFDGVVSSGDGTIDTSNINGESKPYYAKKGSMITSGTKLLSMMLMVKVTSTFEDSTLNKLIMSIKKTNDAKPKMQDVSDKIYKIFIPSVLLITLLSFILWITISYIFEIHPITSSSSSHVYNAFYISISVLAISCPCAMTMASPLVSFVTAQFYWRNNIVFNKIKDLEKISKVTDVVLDKTGTLTTGEMEIIKSFGNESNHKIASALESDFFHPIAISIYKKYNSNIKATDLVNIPGIGISGKVDGIEYTIKKTIEQEIVDTFKEQPGNGTLVGLYRANKLISAYVLKSEIKENAKELIKWFKSKNIKPIILSGDNNDSTKEVANYLEVEYLANQTPEDKAKYIQSLQKQKKVTMMIGDGLNDSIAIKYADVSASFSEGSEIANSYSSISLLSNNLKTIIFLFNISKKAKRNYLLALFWAMAFNVLLIPVAVSGIMFPWAATSAMYISNIVLYSIIVCYYIGLGLLEKKVFGKRTDPKGDKTPIIKEEMMENEHCH